MRNFHEKVQEIEQRTIQFIDVSFQKLRSAEGAFELWENFNNIEHRKAIQEQMMEKFSNILQQYGYGTPLYPRVMLNLLLLTYDLRVQKRGSAGARHLRAEQGQAACIAQSAASGGCDCLGSIALSSD